jgi:hypothetical protein
VRAKVFDVQQILSCAFIAAPQLSLICEELGTLEHELSSRNWEMSDIFQRTKNQSNAASSSSTAPDTKQQHSKFNHNAMELVPSTDNIVMPPPPPPVFDNTFATQRPSSASNRGHRNSVNKGVSSFFAKSSIDKPKDFFRHSTPSSSSSSSSTTSLSGATSASKKSKNKAKKSKGKISSSTSLTSLNKSSDGVDNSLPFDDDDDLTTFITTSQLDNILQSMGGLRHRGNRGGDNLINENNQKVLSAPRNLYDVEQQPGFANSDHHHHHQDQDQFGDEDSEMGSNLGSEELLEQFESRVSHLDSLVHSFEESCLIIDNDDELEEFDSSGGGGGVGGGATSSSQRSKVVVLKTMRGGEFDATTHHLRESQGEYDDDIEGEFSRSVFTKSNQTTSNLSDISGRSRGEQQFDEASTNDDEVILSKLADALTSRIQSLYG